MKKTQFYFCFFFFLDGVLSLMVPLFFCDSGLGLLFSFVVLKASCCCFVDDNDDVAVWFLVLVGCLVDFSSWLINGVVEAEAEQKIQ